MAQHVKEFLDTSKRHVSGATKHEACPACRTRGADTRGDNLGRYPDGHAWCFSCGYYEPPDVEKEMFNAFRTAPSWRKEEIESNDNFVMFPTDFTRYIPIPALKWLGKYGITSKDITKHKFGWSPSLKRLIMPVFDADNRVVMWQGRSLEKEPKYLTRGPVSGICHLITSPDWTHGKAAVTGTLEVILTEGLLDAIKVARLVPAVPLWGSNASLELLRKLAKQFELMGVWLDPDKTPQAVRTALRASQFVPSYVITSTEDPKVYSEDQIVRFVDEAGKPSKRIWKDDELPVANATQI